MSKPFLAKGVKIHNLTLISDEYSIKNKGRSRRWFTVQCDCSFVFKVAATYLRTNRATKCKYCAVKLRESNKVKVSFLEQLYNNKIVIRCRDNNYETDITIDDFYNFIIGNCYYCNQEPNMISSIPERKYTPLNSFKINGIDRLDSTKGYLKSNCVTCCGTCNMMKMDLSYSDFLIKIHQICKNRIL